MILSALEGLARRRGSSLLVAALALGALGASPAPALAAAKLGIKMTHANVFGSEGGVDPHTGSGETFARESGANTYTLKITNEGSGPTSGTVTVLDQLPPGMVLAGKRLGSGSSPLQVEAGTEWKCNVLAGGVAAECSTAQPLEHGKSYGPITLHVHVKPEAADTSTNKAKVSEGGAEVAKTTEEEGKTTVTEAVPFGIQTFTTSAVESLGNPFSQAGGHPFAYTTELVFNTTTGDEGELYGAGGGPKDVEVELPPGFIGNLQNVPRCPLASLQGKGCPANTAVGFVAVQTGGRVEAGQAKIFREPPGASESSLVWNVEPAPGHVAALGFVAVELTPFTIEAAVRSGGDYGVTVGDNAGPNVPRLVGVKLTTCENGATRTVFQAAEFHPGIAMSCKPAPAASKPFLANQTACAGPAPITTVRADPWEEKPPVYRSKTVGTNLVAGALSEKSFLTGCESLRFHPEIAFRPSPPSEGGSTQADEPTGMALDMKLPQTNEAAVNATPALKNLKMTLPAGMTVSPSAADGLQACSDAQFWPPEHGGEPAAEHREPAVPAECPTASQIGTVEVFTPLLSGAPAIEGVPRKGQVLKCSEGSWSPKPRGGSPALSYQWLRNGVAIPGASGNLFPGEYVPVAADEGQALQCQVTATNAGGSSVAVSRDVVGQVPGFTGKVQTGSKIVTEVTSFTGVTVGSELSGGGGKENLETPSCREPNIEVSIACSGIASGATVIGFNQAKKELEMSLPATRAEQGSIGVTPAPPFPPPSIAAPSGTASAGHTLTCASGAWTSHPTPEFPTPAFAYQWLRGGVPIAGASTSSYTLGSEDEGKVIQCRVTGTNAAGKVIADSAAVVAAPVPSQPPLPGAALQGQLFVGQPECSPCSNEDAQDGKLLRVFLQIQDPRDGLIVKLHGINRPNLVTGQLESEFVNQPQTPFELLQLKLKGGPRAPLANPQSCGPAVTTTDLTPWSAPGLGGLSGEEKIPGTPDATPSSQFNVDFNGAGGACPGGFAFNPSFEAGTTGPTATSPGAFTPFSVTFSRQDREQDLSGVQVRMPKGLAAKIAAVPQCGEAQANAGTCPPESQIGTTTSGAGPGPSPFFVSGRVYLTGSYKGEPFGLSIVVPAVAGPFNLGNVVVRSAISVDPRTGAATVTSDPLPQILDGVPFRLRQVNAIIDRPGFVFNPTNCTEQHVSATLSSAQGASAQVSSPFGIGGCGSLPFHPTFTSSTQAETSKAHGASLITRTTSGPGQANIGKAKVVLPKALPSRETTIQQACDDKIFNVNPAACPAGSVIGYATAITPVLKSPLTGPAYLVSHRAEAFPDVLFLLQGEGVTVELDGQTDIKNGITTSTFNEVPDAPVSSFETVFPEGPHSALSAYVPNTGSLCTEPLVMPTTLTGQNGAVIQQETHVTVTGCPHAKATVKVTKTKLKGNTLLVTVNTSAKGTVRVSGKGLRTTSKNLTAGTHQIQVALTNVGRSMRAHHKKITVSASLTVAGRAAAKTARSVRL